MPPSFGPTARFLWLQVLAEIKATHLPLLTVWNKVDACAQPQKIREIAAHRPNTVAVSAETGEGIPELLEILETQLSKQLKDVHCLVPYSQVCCGSASLCQN